MTTPQNSTPNLNSVAKAKQVSNEKLVEAKVKEALTTYGLAKDVGGKYLLFQNHLLGAGAYGSVHRGICRRTGQTVAIKFMEKAKLSQTALDRVSREVKAMQVLSRHCENVVRIYDHQISSSKHYLIMELCEGKSLDDVIKEKVTEGVKHPRLPEPLARKLFQDLCCALWFMAHLKPRISHRDLKPANLLVDPEMSQLKVADFGLSSVKEEELGDKLVSVVGSQLYAPPEALLNSADPSRPGYNGQCFDVWSSGICLFQITTGYLPFGNASEILARDPPEIAQYKAQQRQKKTAHLSQALRDLLGRMLEPNPDKRITIDQIIDHSWFNEPLSDGTVFSQVKEKRLKAPDSEAQEASAELHRENEKASNSNHGVPAATTKISASPATASPATAATSGGGNNNNEQDELAHSTFLPSSPSSPEESSQKEESS